MSYRAQISKLRADVAAIKAAAPTAKFVLYNADDEDVFADVVSFGGTGAADLVRIPREMMLDDWIQMIKREVAVRARFADQSWPRASTHVVRSMARTKWAALNQRRAGAPATF